ncbi:hypothetical protein J2848_000941 [Azospirillum lipoferum]|uniref:Lipoprotein n=1 Tax=Azospirillum lipoferum TaxID=193 RepID=A0A5A9GWQ6_AZOLI|nr:MULTISPECIES: hypothetical protein [Azospirillum]KAA0598683.1 hypothetical protein FZ942_06340 [Azospirillum lipoferum]MCP1609294.1 hypothetical protein [Azospirillum lipoferum]MDW5535396.1 hypothetical protein [Azospirillum sp. NL1]
MRMFPPPAALLLSVSALAACTNERVVASEPTPAYTRAEVAYAASDRDLRVVLHGNPFGLPPDRFAEKVLPNMQDRVFGVKTNLTTTPNDTARRDYKVVLAFNLVENTLNSALCTEGPMRTAPPGGPIVVQGAFCRSGAALTSATGWLDRPQGPDDSDFRNLISDMTFSLFPSQRSDLFCGRPDC